MCLWMQVKPQVALGTYVVAEMIGGTVRVRLQLVHTPIAAQGKKPSTN